MKLRIIVFPLGYLWGLELNKIVNKLNKVSKSFEISIGEPIRNIGNADLYGFGYSYKRLFSFFPKQGAETIQIGITSVPIEGNYFGNYEDGTNNIVCTLFEMDEVCEKADTTREEYVSQAILTAILWHQYKKSQPNAHHLDLFHDDVRGCLFDFCGNKLDLVTGLRAKQVDPICRGKLIGANVSENVVEEVEKALNRMRTPSFLQSIVEGMKIPLFSFLLGGLVLGLLISVTSSLLLGDFNSPMDYYTIAILSVIALFLVIGNFFLALRRSKKRNYS